jgi:hypothetical protein
MVRPTDNTFRECLRSLTPWRAAVLESLRKTDLLPCLGGLLIGSVIGMSMAIFPEQLEKINPRYAALDKLRLELSEMRAATAQTTEPWKSKRSTHCLVPCQ